jgi:hypothetical protein
VCAGAADGGVVVVAIFRSSALQFSGRWTTPLPYGLLSKMHYSLREYSQNQRKKVIKSEKRAFSISVKTPFTCNASYNAIAASVSPARGIQIITHDGKETCFVPRLPAYFLCRACLLMCLCWEADGVRSTRSIFLSTAAFMIFFISVCVMCEYSDLPVQAGQIFPACTPSMGPLRNARATMLLASAASCGSNLVFFLGHRGSLRLKIDNSAYKITSSNARTAFFTN